MLKIAKDLALPLEDDRNSVTSTFGVLAVRGAGKSNLAAVMAEGLDAAGAPFVVVDPKGDWWGLRASADGKKPGLPIPIFGGLHQDVRIEPSGGALIADLIFDRNLTCLLDVSDFSKAARAQFLVGFADRLYQRHRRDRQPRHVFFEEAHEYIPQQIPSSRVDSQAGTLKEACSRLVLQGRAFGLGSSVVSQRSARVHKDVLTQLDTLIAMRTTAPQDRGAILAWVEEHQVAKDLARTLAELKDGEAWVWSPQFMGISQRITFRQRRTFDSGATPKLGAIRKARRSPTLAEIDLSAIEQEMAETIERAKADDPRELRRRIGELRRKVGQLERELARRPDQAIALKPAGVKRLEDVVQRLEREGERVTARGRELEERARKLVGETREVGRDYSEQLVAAAQAVTAQLRVAAGRVGSSSPGPNPLGPLGLRVKRVIDVTPAPGASGGVARAHAGRPGVEERILDALAELAALGVAKPERVLVAFLAEYSNPGSKGFRNALSGLATRGLVQYPSPGTLELTREGAEAARPPASPATTEQLQERIASLLGGATARVLEPIVRAYPGRLYHAPGSPCASCAFAPRRSCGRCYGQTVTIDVDEGVTPFMIDCRASGRIGDCDGDAYSGFYPEGPRPPGIPAPAWEWYRPGDAERAGLDAATAEHVRLGGLLLRPRRPNGGG